MLFIFKMDNISCLHRTIMGAVYLCNIHVLFSLYNPLLFKDGVVEVRRQGDRIILVKPVISDMVLNVISAYAPQVGHVESAKQLF